MWCSPSWLTTLSEETSKRLDARSDDVPEGASCLFLWCFSIIWTDSKSLESAVDNNFWYAAPIEKFGTTTTFLFWSNVFNKLIDSSEIPEDPIIRFDVAVLHFCIFSFIAEAGENSKI